MSYILTVDATPVSPTTVSSENHIAYKDLGPRPTVGNCGAIDECPECGTDRAYKIPVVAGDNVYTQFHLTDNYNLDPTDPLYGWKSDSPSDDNYYIKATLEFTSLDAIDLETSDIVRSQNVGYSLGSYQNMILDSAKIFDYFNDQGSTGECFRLHIRTYKKQATGVDVQIVLTVNKGFPGVKKPGDVIVQDDYLQTWNGSMWLASITPPEVGDRVFSTNTGLYYEWDGEDWVEGEPAFMLVADGECYGSWNKLVRCEETVLVEGIHGFLDCNGNYYGIDEDLVAAGLLAYRDKYRLYASFEPVGFVTDVETDDNDNQISFDSDVEWLFRTHVPGMPFQIADKLDSTLKGSPLYINGNEYHTPTDIKKLADVGKMWFSQFTIRRDKCEKNGTCVSEITFNPVVACDELNPVDCPVFVDVVVLRDGEPYATGESGEIIDVLCECPPAGTVTVTRDGTPFAVVDCGDAIDVPSDCAPADPVTVENSDQSYSVEVDGGDTLVLEDITTKVYINGVLRSTTTSPAMVNRDINIIWV